MRRWFHQHDDPDVDDRYLTDDQVERLAGVLLEQAYELVAADPSPTQTGLTGPPDLRIVLGARDAVGWRIRQDSRGSDDVRAYGLIDSLMPPDLRVPLDVR
jgi:hypothetical protein